MIGLSETSGLSALLVITRIAACFTLLPGFGSPRLTPRFRLLLALAISSLFLPLMWPVAEQQARAGDLAHWGRLLAGEFAIGLVLGLMARFALLGVQFAGSLIASSTGLAPNAGLSIDETELAPPLANIMTLTATMLIFASGAHYIMLEALLDSYVSVPIGSSLDTGWLLDQLVTKLSASWTMGLRLSAPLLVFSAISNLAIGFANKFTPQISAYFIASGLVAVLVLFLLMGTIDDILGLFLQEFPGYTG